LLQHNVQRLQLLGIHGDELEELEFVLIPSEFVDDHLPDVRSQAFNQTDLLPEPGIKLHTGYFIGSYRKTMHGRLQNANQ
jgi:hypothetical protein